MEAVIFCGLQASGKTSFYAARFLRTHVRISRDLMKTRHREAAFLATCLQTGQRFVADNTHPARADRGRIIAAARAHRFRVTGFYFSAPVEACLMRNRGRPSPERVPDAGLRDAFRRLELPVLDEGFDRLFEVALDETGFAVSV
jgi:predicted kinase